MTLSILGTRRLTRDDLARRPEGHLAAPPVVNLRNAHHNIARLIASGLKVIEIAEATGYSANRITMLRNSPAFEELVAHYRAMVDAAWLRDRDEFFSRSTANMRIAEDLLHERLTAAALDDDGPEITTRDLVAISADRADRHGYPKHTNNTNVNVNWAEALERANSRLRPLPLRSEEENVEV